MAAIHAHRRTGIPSLYDANALAYLQAAGINPASTYYTGTPYQITGQAMWNATDALIRALKSNNLWVRLQTLYPLLGGTLASCAVNAKTPGTNNLTYVNTPGCDARGLRFNGANQLASTGISAGMMVAGQGYGLDYYSADGTSIGGDVIEMGGNDQSNGLFIAVRNQPGGNKTVGRASGQGTSASSTNSVANSLGLFTIDRDASGMGNVSRNGGFVGASVDMGSLPTSPSKITLGALNIGGVNLSGYGFSDRGCSWACIRGSFTVAETATYYSLIQAFQAALNRAV